MRKQGLNQLPLCQAVSRANLTALVENVWHLVTSAIFGVSYSESFAKLMPDGSWEKMYQGCSQVKMEGFSEEYLGTWPKWGVMYGGTVFQPMRSVQSFGVSESHLWPRPIASDSIAWTKCRACNPRITIVKMWERHGQDRPIYDFMWHGLSVTQAAEFHEMMMGFPPHWTDLNVSEMR